MLVRVTSAAIALLACAWFALSAREAHELSQANATLSARQAPSGGQAAQLRSLLSAAGTLNPDSRPSILRAELDLDLGQGPAAERILQRVVGDEPMNLEAWILLAEAAPKNKRLVDESLLRVHELDPRG